MKFLVLFFAALIPAFLVEGNVILSENFNYPDGPIVGASGSPWVNTSGTAGGALVVSGKLEVSEDRAEDINALLPGQPYTTASGTVLYSSFTIVFSELPTPGGDYFAHFNSSSGRGRIFASTTGAPDDFFRLGIGNSTTATETSGQLPTNLSLNETYFVVTRYDVASGLSTLWLNPIAESDPSVTASDTAGPTSISRFAFRQAASEGVMQIDDLKVATTFAEVISSSPVTAPIIVAQPQSQTVYAGSTVEFSVDADGSAPLIYQWKFNGTNLANGNNATLSLTNVTSTNAGSYSVVVSNYAGTTNSAAATLTVEPAPPAALSLVNYNLHGNMVENWSTNSFQVKAIGRIVKFLNADVFTFQEIPATNTYQMTNFVKAFLPGYYLATNSGTDGFETNYIRSVIASRYPITRSQSWLDGANLDPFGYTNSNFTRDLFEAEIAVPGLSQPVHVFTTHLKSGTGSSDDAAKRAAEARAISNFFVTVFLPAKGNRPYLLTGDLNEDINISATGSQQPIQKLANSATGLRLTSPLNPFTGNELTFSIQTPSGPTRRYDYIMPGGLLFSNIVGSQVFRTDLLNPVPPGLNASDSEWASDHLPVMMFFANPYAAPFQITSTILSNQMLTLNWQSFSGQQYRVESSTTLTNWNPASQTITATGTNTTFTTNTSDAVGFFRINRVF